MPVAFGMSVTLPGIPVIFAGDERSLAIETVELYSRLVAARAAFDLTLPPHAVSGEAVRLFGDAMALVRGGTLRLHGAGPSFGAWQLPGVELPASQVLSDGPPRSRAEANKRARGGC